MKTPRYHSAFTLIELLVVIAIIGILASLALPAVNGALDSARRTQAKNDVVQIATAITGYETEYGKLPDVSSGDVDLTLVKILTGETKGPESPNPRGIVFLEVQEAKSKKSGTNSSGFVDPWDNTYQVQMDNEGGDKSYDNEITFSAGKLSGSGSDSITLRKKVAVYNFSSSSGSGSDKNHSRRAVRSWE